MLSAPLSRRLQPVRGAVKPAVSPLCLAGQVLPPQPKDRECRSHRARPARRQGRRASGGGWWRGRGLACWPIGCRSQAPQPGFGWGGATPPAITPESGRRQRLLRHPGRLRAPRASRTGRAGRLDIGAPLRRLLAHVVKPDGFDRWREGDVEIPFFLEYDRGTEPLDRLAAKLYAYQELAVAPRSQSRCCSGCPAPAGGPPSARPLPARAAGTRSVCGGHRQPDPCPRPGRGRVAAAGKTWLRRRLVDLAGPDAPPRRPDRLRGLLIHRPARPQPAPLNPAGNFRFAATIAQAPPLENPAATHGQAAAPHCSVVGPGPCQRQSAGARRNGGDGGRAYTPRPLALTAGPRVLLGAAAALSRKRHGRHPQFIAGSQPQAVIVCSIMASQGKDVPDATDPGSPREPRLCGCSGIHGRTLQAAPCQSDSARCRRLAVESPEARTRDTSRWRRSPAQRRSTAARTRPKMPPPSPSIRNRPSGRTTIPDRRPHYSINPPRCGGALSHLLQRCVLTTSP